MRVANDVPFRRVPGTYRNGAELLEVVVMDGRPALKSGDIIFDLQPLAGGSIGAMTQGRLALRFRLIHDAEGRAYLWLADRAFARDP